MKIEVKIDPSCHEPKLLILTDSLTDEVNSILKKLSGGETQLIAGFREGSAELFEGADMIRVYSAAGKVFAATRRGEYALRLRLYEAEERLADNYFVRISNSELVNLKEVRGFDLSLAGTIRVTLSDGTVTYVSRRYVAKIKQVLGM